MRSSDSFRGFVYALLAFFFWGFVPLFWKQIQEVPAEEILAHRITWSAAITSLLLIAFGNCKTLTSALRSPRTLLTFVLTALLIAINWLLFIWGVNHGRILETSLGYYILPLVSVFLGVAFLGERLRRLQMAAVGLAAISVIILTYEYGHLPWIALVLAISMAVYALIRKTAPLESLEGLFLETALLLPFTLLFIVQRELSGVGHFLHGTTKSAIFLVLGGAVTSIPLLLFNAAARRISLSSVGIMQYISPTLQFLTAILVYQETLSHGQIAAFAGIWLALGLYSWDALRYRQRPEAVPPILE